MSDAITPIVVDTDENSDCLPPLNTEVNNRPGSSKNLDTFPTVKKIRSEENHKLDDADVIVELEENEFFDANGEIKHTIPVKKTRSGASSSNASTKPSLLDNPKISTIRQHYYPEGGWGWVICVCGFVINMVTNGLLLSYGVLYRELLTEFGEENASEAMWLGSTSLSTGLFVSPFIVALCRRKSTRLTAVFGGLTSALGCLFTSFASQLHQVFFSYGFLMAVGLGMARETSSLMAGQYFKRRRELVEAIIQSGTGIGVSLFSYVISHIIRSLGWRLGLHAVTGIAVIPFFVGIFYRSASLYHPQRRAIVHLKNQRKKIKDKSGVSDKPPFFDVAPLKSGALLVTMVSVGVCSFGLYSPFYNFIPIIEAEGIEQNSLLVLQVHLGCAYTLGCWIFGLMVVKRSTECMISKPYLCQIAMVGSGLSHFCFCVIQGYHGYVLFVWMYGTFCGGLHYALKVLVFENIRAKSYGRAWGYVEWAKSIPVLIGIPVTGYINKSYNSKAGFYFSAGCCFTGAFAMTCIHMYRYSYTSSRRSQGSCSTCTSQAPSELRTQDSIDTAVCSCNSVHSKNSCTIPAHRKCQKTISFASTVNIAQDQADVPFESLPNDIGLPEEVLFCDNCVACSGHLTNSVKDDQCEKHSPVDKSNDETTQYQCGHMENSNRHFRVMQATKRPSTVIEEVTSVV